MATDVTGVTELSIDVLTGDYEDDKWQRFLMFCSRWYAGASFEFETNKGRVISFHPYLATRFEE